MRRRGQQDQVDSGVDHALVGVEADKAAFVRDVDTGIDVVVLQQVLQAEFDPFGEQVADRHQAFGALGQQGFPACPGAAIAAADQTDANDVAARGVRGAGDVQSGGQGCGGGGPASEARCRRSGGCGTLFFGLTGLHHDGSLET